MSIRRSYFLIVAEEGSFSRAAKRLHISQQAVSVAIKNLEYEFGTQLFTRKPEFKLTLAGERLLQTYQRMQMLEQNIKGELQEIAAEQHGRITVGIHSARAHAVLPRILEQYWRDYPGAVVDVVDGITLDFEKSLLDGRLDVFFGVNASAHPLMHHRQVAEERVFLVISDALLERHFPDFPGCKARFAQGVDLKDFEGIPFVMNHKSSRTTDLILQYLDAGSILLSIRLYSNSGALRLALCAADCAAHIGMQPRVKYPHMFADKSSACGRLNFFPVRGFAVGNKITVSYHASVYQPQYLKAFIAIAETVLAEIYREDSALPDAMPKVRQEQYR